MTKTNKGVYWILYPIVILSFILTCETKKGSVLGKIFNALLTAWFDITKSIALKKFKAFTVVFIIALFGVMAEATDYWLPSSLYSTLWYRFPINIYKSAHWRFLYIIQHFLQHMHEQIVDIVSECTEMYIEEVRELGGR